MQTRSSLQRRMSSENSDRFVNSLPPTRPWSDPLYEQAKHSQRSHQGYDLSNIDLFSHDPGPRSYSQVNPGAQSHAVQAKTVGAPNHQYEQEVDRVAEQVINMPDSAAQQSIQRESADEEELQMKPLSATITPLVQREAADENKLQMKSSAPVATPSSGLEDRLAQSKSSGSPLSENVRTFMEPRFGADFSQVRVHTGEDSVQMNQDLNAQAFTQGQDIYFGAGKSPTNDALTAHELTHVVQQTGGVQSKLAMCNSTIDRVMRDTTDSQTEEVSVSLASDQEANGIGHSWVIINKPDKSKDSYGFWPNDITVLGSLALGWYPGRIFHPDDMHKPNALFTRKTTMKLLQQGIEYANSKSNSSYHLLAFNCATFARRMFEKATGRAAPSGGLLIDSPNELADKISDRNREQKLNAMEEPLQFGIFDGLN